MPSEATRKASKSVPAAAAAVGVEADLEEVAVVVAEVAEVAEVEAVELVKAALANVHGKTKTRPAEEITTGNAGTTRKWPVQGLVRALRLDEHDILEEHRGGELVYNTCGLSNGQKIQYNEAIQKKK